MFYKFKPYLFTNFKSHWSTTSDLSSMSSHRADAQVQDFLLHSQSDVSNTSQGKWLQQTCTLFIQSGVQLLTDFTQNAAAWANTSVVRANLSQPNHSLSQPERAGNGKHVYQISIIVITYLTWDVLWELLQWYNRKLFKPHLAPCSDLFLLILCRGCVSHLLWSFALP